MRRMLLLMVATVLTAGTAAAQTAEDSVRAERQRYVQALRQAIAGKEDLPAGEVFRNIQVMTNVPAGRLLNIMDMGYANSLGVSCNHCHVVDEWDSEEKPQKQIARDMMAMVGRINRELLASIPNLRSEQPIVNCTTCHRGDVKPATNMPPGG